LQATADTRTYVQDMIYEINIPGSSLHTALVFCELSYYSSEPPLWTDASLVDPLEGYFSFQAGILDPHFRLLLSPDEVAALGGVVIDPTFVPYEEVNTGAIIIPDDELDIILSEIGRPFVKFEELEISKAQINSVILKPVLDEYFKRFPIIQPERVQAQYAGVNGSKFEVPVPSGAYGATRVVVLQGVQAGNKPGNPFHFWASEVMWAGGSPGSTYPGVRSGQGPRYANLQGFGAVTLDRAARQGIINYASRIHFRIQRDKGGNRKLIGHSNKIGLIEVHWAYTSNNWIDVDFRRLGEVRKLAAARVLRHLGMLRSQVKTDTPGAINYEMFISRAKELEDEVMTFWKEIPKAVVIRG
jgi:hypothetical protein